LAVFRRPVPQRARLIVALLAVAPFILAWWTFWFPLTYCDSDGWAPSYLGRLTGRVTAIGGGPRGWVVPAYFHVLGAWSIALGSGNLIGLVQAAMVAAALLWMSAKCAEGAVIAELILAPALVFSGLRYAIYSQTVLSESFVVVLSILVWMTMLSSSIRPGHALLVGAAAAVLAHARVDMLYVAPLLLVRLASRRNARRLVNTALAAAAMIAARVALSTVEMPSSPGIYPIGKLMVMAEWMRYTQPPHNALAGLARNDLVDRFIPVVARHQIRDVYAGLGPARSVYRETADPSWSAVARLIVYQCVNRPLMVLGDRLATSADLYATAYAAFWPGYRPWSSYYSSYGNAFSNWTPDVLDQRYPPCARFFDAQTRFYQHPRIRSRRACGVLLWLHHAAQWYSLAVIRPLMWLALPVCLVLLLRGRGGSTYYWITALIVAHLALRAFLVCADERYELPIDLLLVWWLALSIRQLSCAFRHAGLRAGTPACRPAP